MIKKIVAYSLPGSVALMVFAGTGIGMSATGAPVIVIVLMLIIEAWLFTPFVKEEAQAFLRRFSR